MSLSLMGGTFGYFDDFEENTDNGFAVGTWAVEEAESGGDTATLTLQGLSANDSGTKTWTVKNTGTVSGYVDISISVAEDGTGDLGNYLIAHLTDSDGDDIYGPDVISGMAGNYDLDLPLEAGESKIITLDWNVDGDYVPYDSNDKVALTISFDIKPAP